VKAVYIWTAKGVMPDGTKIRVSGTVTNEEDGTRFPPHEAFEKARKLVEDQFPGIKVEGDKEVNGMPIKQFPTLQKSKKETARLQRKFGTKKASNS
jgi:hypothetical protein